MVPFVVWLGHRRGGELYLTPVRRCSKVMVTLFAGGVITGTVLSFEMGMLPPTFTATFGSVCGRGFAIEGFSFFLKAIFIGIYATAGGDCHPGHTCSAGSRSSSRA
jgi:cytochrome d ubiquinol oxidase subunit I